MFIHQPHKLLSRLLCTFLRILQKSIFFSTLLKLNQRLYDQVADINSWVARYLMSVLWLIVTYCALGSFGLIELWFFCWFFIWCVLWYFFAFSYQSYLIVNRTESPFNLAWRHVFAVFLLANALLTKILTATACAFVKLLFGRLWRELNIFPGNGPLLINFLEDLIIDILKIDCETVVQVRNRSFSVLTIGYEHFIVVCSWHEQIKGEFIGLMIGLRMALCTGVIFEIFGFEGIVRGVLEGVECDSVNGLGNGAHLRIRTIGKCSDCYVRLFLN